MQGDDRAHFRLITPLSVCRDHLERQEGVCTRTSEAAQRCLNADRRMNGRGGKKI